MTATMIHYKQNFLVKENRLVHLIRRLVRKYNFNKLAEKIRIDTNMPPYPAF